MKVNSDLACNGNISEMLDYCGYLLVKKKAHMQPIMNFNLIKCDFNAPEL